MIPTWLLCYITNQVFVAQTKHRKLEALEKKKQTSAAESLEKLLVSILFAA